MPTRIPALSIGLPVFNGEPYLAGALRCLLGQDHEDFELIISDNASTDATEAICREHAGRDSRIRYHRNARNIGASANYNLVFRMARGEFFKWASHDDECDRSLVRRCLDVFRQAGRRAVLVFSRADIIDDTGRVMFESPDHVSSSSPRPFQRLGRVLWSSSYAHPLWGVIRADALRQTGLMGCIEADQVVLAELAMLGELIEIPLVLYRLRRHPGCATETHHTAEALLAWHDPARTGTRIFLPHHERVCVEHFTRIRRLPLSSPDRWLCLGTVPAVCYWRRFLNWSGPVRHRLGLYRRRSHTLARAGGTPTARPFSAAVLRLHRWVWQHLPARLRDAAVLRPYGVRVHALVRRHAERQQYVGTFFFRNRPELTLMRRLLDRHDDGTVAIAVLGCSKGAEVYSIARALVGARPEVKLTINAVDISREVLEFAARGVYSISPPVDALTDVGHVARSTWKDQDASIFARMTDAEMAGMFDTEGDRVTIKPRLMEHIVWHLADAGDPETAGLLGPQNIVLANRFLCHMPPLDAERCLRNIARLVKPGGYLFVSGIDLDVRTKLATELGWTPVIELLREIHEGDVSLRCGWPLHYWGLEPFQAGADWMIRFASVFQLGPLA